MTTTTKRTPRGNLASVAHAARTMGHVDRADALDHLARLRPCTTDDLTARLATAGVPTAYLGRTV